MGVKFGSHIVNHWVPWTVSRHSLSARGTFSPHPDLTAAPWRGQEGCRKAVLLIWKHMDNQTPWHGSYVEKKMSHNAWISDIFCSHTQFSPFRQGAAVWLHLTNTLFTRRQHHPCNSQRASQRPCTQHIQVNTSSCLQRAPFHPHNLHP